MTRKWLLLFNCQALGLGRCLEVLHGDVTVESYDALASQQLLPQIRQGIEGYEQILIAPRVRNFIAADIAGRSNVTWVPHVFFQGYHPDLCYLGSSGALAKGPLGAYHSVIAYAAWRAGLDVAATLALYRTETFRALGYMEAWAAARDEFLAGYEACGLDLRAAFVDWSRSGPFMHSINHPKIHVLMDLARVLLRRLGVEVRESGIVPPDNLALGPIFPVYPEVGAALGVAGSYLFKPSEGYRLHTLETFVEASRAQYDSDADAKPDNPQFLPLLDRAQALLAGNAAGR